MKKLLAAVALLVLISCHTNTNTKSTTYTLKSFPTYDELGNYYEMDTTFDHKPTHEDTIKFYQSSDAQLQEFADSVVKARTNPTAN
jgi:hypothetical protein